MCGGRKGLKEEKDNNSRKLGFGERDFRLRTGTNEKGCKTDDVYLLSAV